MTDALVPRLVTSVLVEEEADSVTVTWSLGERVPVEAVENFGYGVDYFGPDSAGGKQLTVDVYSDLQAHILDRHSNTRANYDADCVTVGDGSLVVRYRDASIGLVEVGKIDAFSFVNSEDVQTGIPVTLLR